MLVKVKHLYCTPITIIAQTCHGHIFQLLAVLSVKNNRIIVGSNHVRGCSRLTPNWSFKKHALVGVGTEMHTQHLPAHLLMT